MTIIAVAGITYMTSMRHIINVIAKIICEDIQGLSFEICKYGKKIFYFRLPDHCDPQICIQQINNTVHSHYVFKAFLPKKIPNLRIAKIQRTVPDKLCKSLGIVMKCSKSAVYKMMEQAAEALLCELYDRYPGMLDLEEKTDDSLRCKIRDTILTRIKDMQEGQMEDDEEAIYRRADWSSLVTAEYRSMYPHETDFALVEECLRAGGGNSEAEQLTEEMLTALPKTSRHPVVKETIFLKKVTQAISAYESVATAKMTEYIDSLDVDVDESLTGEQAGRNMVRKELKNISPNIHKFLRVCAGKNVLTRNLNVRVYGMPCLPPLNTVKKFLRKYAGKYTPSDHLFNCLDVVLPRSNLGAFLEEDGITLDGCTLLIKLFSKLKLKNVTSKVNPVQDSLGEDVNPNDIQIISDDNDDCED